MNDAVEMTANQFQQNISTKLADDYLSTLLTGNVMEIPVDLTIIFNSALFSIANIDPSEARIKKNEVTTLDQRKSLVCSDTSQTSVELQYDNKNCNDELSLSFVDYNDILKESELDIMFLDIYSQLAGLVSPSKLLYATRKEESLLAYQAVNNTIQIHWVNGHFAVSHIKDNTIVVYDSLHSDQRLQQVYSQILFIRNELGLFFHKFEIKYVVPQQQTNSVDCGLYAAANAACLLSGQDHKGKSYDPLKLRSHLLMCLQEQRLSQFPERNTASCSNFTSNTVVETEKEIKTNDCNMLHYEFQNNSDYNRDDWKRKRVSQRKQEKRKDFNYKQKEQEKNTKRKQELRLNIDYKARGQQNNTLNKRGKRDDVLFRLSEQHLDTERRRIKRTCSSYKMERSGDKCFMRAK